MFVDLVGFTASSEQADPEDVGKRLAAYHKAVRTEIERYEGRVEKLIGDGVFAVFGVPSAHEDDPDRAVRAALRIQEGVDKLNEERADLALSARVAITTGEAMVRIDPAPDEETIVGDVVNTASRLEGEAPPGGVLVDQRTYMASQTAIEYEALSPVTVKGKVEPIPVWSAVQARSSYGVGVERDPTTPFVGRRRDLRLIEETFGRVVEDSSVQLMTVSGEPGAGKSRLVAEFHKVLDDHPEFIWWRQGRNLPYGEGVSYWALSEIVKAHAGILENEPIPESKKKLATVLSDLLDDEQEERWVESRLMPLIGSSDELGGAERSELFSAWLRFLEALAGKQPLVLVFEDLHWADPPLIEFVRHVVDRATESPILILATARPELYSDHPDWGGGLRNATSIALAPLTAEETAELVSALGGSADSEEVIALAERSGGNPLYATEFVRMLRDSEGGGGLELPESIQALIAARIDLLTPEDKTLLQTASVVGKVFWTGAVAFAAHEDVGEASDRLGEIAKRELIRRVRRPSMQGQEEWSFWHDLVRDVAYGQLPRATRSGTHVGLAEWIEAAAADRIEEVSEVLAHHYSTALELTEAAGDPVGDLPQHAFRFLYMAGKRLQYLDSGKSHDLLDRALLLEIPDLDRARASSVLGEVMWAVAEYDRSEKLLDEAIELAQAQGDRELEAESWDRYASLMWSKNDGEAVDRASDRAVALVREMKPSPLVAQTLASAAAKVWLRGEGDETEMAEEALAMALDVNDVEAELRALTAIGGFRLARGDEGGLEDHRQVLQRALELGSPLAGAAFNNVATHLLDYPDGPTEAIDLMKEAIDWTASRGFEAGADWSTNTLIEALIQTLDWSGVDSLVADIVSRNGVDTQIGIIARGWVAEFANHRGDPQRAIEIAHEYLEGSRAVKDAQVLIADLAQVSLMEAAAGNLEAAAELVAEFRDTGIVNAEKTYRYLPWAAEAAAIAGATEIVSEILETGSHPRPYHEAAFSESWAWVHEARGEYEDAAQTFAAAAEGYERIYELRRAYALAGLARTKKALGQEVEASAAAAGAREIAEVIGAKRVLDQIPEI